MAGFAVGVGVACVGGGVLAVQRGGSGGWLFFLGLWFLLGTAGAFLLRRLAFPRERRAGWPGFRRMGRFLGMFVVALLLGEAIGYGAYAMLRGELLKTAWTLPADSVEPKAFWGTADALVRVRSDGVASYGTRDGKPLWSRGLSVCRASRNAGEGVGLVSFSSAGKACDRLTALDLSTGQSLWTAKTGAAGRSFGWETGSGIAVRPSRAGLKVFDLRTGAPRRAPRPPAKCVFNARSSVQADGGRLAATAFCKNGSTRLVMADPEGRTLWTAPLKTERPTVLSAAPPVLRRERELLVFDPHDGTPTGTIPAPSPADAPILIGNGRIHVMDGKSTIRTHAPNGDLLWSATVGSPLRGVHLADSTLYAVYDSGFSAPTTLTALDARSGAKTQEATVPYPAENSPALHTTPDRVLFLPRSQPDKSTPAVHAFIR
ncbi:hypothetical protein GCM10009550_04460 [Actinocorallia libanotica]|uniref:Pyrrolo-quinoline quinone repeat domain-containing protein n=1 Tax=Actinocorallia libanotica TaxID=46162 RepID=A0ABN1Q636_9ACTN